MYYGVCQIQLKRTWVPQGSTLLPLVYASKSAGPPWWEPRDTGMRAVSVFRASLIPEYGHRTRQKPKNTEKMRVMASYILKGTVDLPNLYTVVTTLGMYVTVSLGVTWLETMVGSTWSLV